MKKTLFTYYLKTANFLSGDLILDFLYAVYDEATDTISVEVQSGFLRQATTNTSVGDAYSIVPGVVSEYSFQQGGDTVRFVSSATFPYAVKQVVAPPPPPPPFTDAISIAANAFDETVFGGGDGRIEVTASTVSPLKEITVLSLTAGVFVRVITVPPGADPATVWDIANLAPGDYRVTATNFAGGTAIANVRVNAFRLDTYGLFARAEYESDVFRTPIRIDIKKKDYAGVVRTACANPATRTYKGTKTAFLTSYIYGLSLDFGLLAESLRDWSVLYTQDDREYLVEYFVGGDMKFRGYLLPEFLDQAYFDGKHVARFTATDGLGQLKDFAFARRDGTRYQGVATLGQILRDCLAYVALDIELFNGIVWTTDIGGPTPSYDANVLETVSVDRGLFYEHFSSPTCEDVVHSVCIAFGGASLFQSGGKFVLLSPYNFFPGPEVTLKAKDGTLTLARFSRSGSREQLFSQAENVLVTLESGMSIEPGVQTISLTEKLLPTQGLIPFSNLQAPDSYEFAGGFLTNFFIPEKPVSFFTDGRFGLFQLKPTGGFLAANPFAFGLPENLDGFVFEAVSHRFSDTRRLTADMGTLNRETDPYNAASELGFLVYIKLNMAAVRGPVRCRFQVRFGPAYLGQNASEWTLAESWITYTFNPGDFDTDKEVSVITPPLPESLGGAPLPSGRVGLTITSPYLFRLDNLGRELDGDPSLLLVYPDLQAGPGTVETYKLAVKAAQVKPLVGGAELVSSRPRVFSSQGTFTTRNVSVEQTLGTHYYGKNNTRFYPYAIRDTATGEAVTFWRDQNGDFYEFSQLSHRTLIKARQIPREVIRATLRGRFEFYQKLFLMQDNDLAYFCAEAVYEDNLDTITGIFVYSEGDFPGRLRRIHEQGTGMLTEDEQNTRTFENYLYDEDFTTIF